LTTTLRTENAQIREKTSMQDDQFLKDSRVHDPYVDRRSAEERRQAYDSGYFEAEGVERRTKGDRRQPAERRNSCTRVSRWSSVCPD
jgi:hypothetical protein